MADGLRELVTEPITWLLAVPATVAGYVGLGPLLQFVVDTAPTWFTLAAISGSTLIPELPSAPEGLGTAIVLIAAIAYGSILLGRLLSKGVNRLK